MSGLSWRKPSYDGDRRVARRGDIEVGVVFPPVGSETRWRWRFWLGEKIYPKHGDAKTEADAKSVVASHFARFLIRSRLSPEREIAND